MQIHAVVQESSVGWVVNPDVLPRPEGNRPLVWKDVFATLTWWVPISQFLAQIHPCVS